MCRREGVSICGRERCALKRRPFAPGVHGPTSRSKLTSYGRQLREKQKAKRTYGLMERQFRKYFDAAAKKKGNTGELLVQTLEERLDNVVYRLGLSKTRRQARQLVSHGHLVVDGKPVNIPSYHLRPGQMVEVNKRSQESPYFRGLSEQLEKHLVPSWLQFEAANFSGRVLEHPAGQELEQNFDPKLIVEFYSR